MRYDDLFKEYDHTVKISLSRRTACEIIQITFISKGKRHVELGIRHRIHVLIDVVSGPVTDGRAFSQNKLTGVYISLASSKGIASITMLPHVRIIS